jgi:predicted PurR-regulated permease PerM
LKESEKMNGAKAFGFLGVILSPMMIGVGFIIRKYGDSLIAVFFENPQDVHNLYIRWGFKLKKVTSNTLDNRKKYARHIGNYFIALATFLLILCLFLLLVYS